MLTVVLGQLISNTATVLIMVPIATVLAADLHVSVLPFMMALTVAGAASFLTPVATAANTIIMEPGGYRFGDYWKLGLPLLLFLTVAVLWVPLLWPFAPWGRRCDESGRDSPAQSRAWYRGRAGPAASVDPPARTARTPPVAARHRMCAVDRTRHRAHIAGTLSDTRNPLAYAGLVTGWLLHFRVRNFFDGTNEAAIRTYRRLSTDQLLEVLRRDTPRAVPPGWSRPLPLMGVASLPKYATFGHLADVVLPRDCFMHRYDIGRATGVDVPRDPTDADVVAQVVRDLGPAWTGPAFVLRLSGTGGGEWQVRAGTPDDAALVTLDSVDYLRHLSGRAVSPDLFAGTPESVRGQLRDARVLIAAHASAVHSPALVEQMARAGPLLT